jgi:molybdenum cofactor biosynthesis protein B
MVKDSAMMKSGKDEHHEKAEQLPPARIAIITISDSRTVETDVNGIYLKDQVSQNGFELAGYYLLKDEPTEISILLEELSDTTVNLILLNGGTGISKRDSTFDAVSKKLEKVLPGFGEIFRMLSYEQVGGAAMFSRAIAGVYRDKVIISTPGSPAAVKLAWEKLILPEIPHFIWELTR